MTVENTSSAHRPCIGLTIGDPAGIGPEIVVRALCEPDLYQQLHPLVYADRVILEQTIEQLGCPISLNAVSTAAGGRYENGVIDYVDVGSLSHPVCMGRVSAEGGKAGMAYLECAVNAALSGEITGLATAPLNKESLQAANIPYIDHTAYLQARAARRQPMTLFMVRALRIFFLTRHISFRQIPDALDQKSILSALPLCELYLRQLGVDAPRLAVAALNPHGGEDGLFGREEIEVLIPAVERARASGCNVHGPVPADSVFHQCLAGKYDGVLSLYHDQGHIAAKTLDFHGTVSLSMGLEFLRTSVDHGTAFDIAGQGVADARGMVAAVMAAARYAAMVRHNLDLEP